MLTFARVSLCIYLVRMSVYIHACDWYGLTRSIVIVIPCTFSSFFVVCLFVTKRSKAFGRSLHGIAMHRDIIHVNKFESKTLVDNIE